MCIIILKPQNTAIAESTLKKCWDGNREGAGFAYAEDGVIKLTKGLMTWEDFWKAYSDVNPTERKMLIHFRIQTHGSKGPEMTHPFWVSENNLVMAHNGVISKISSKANATESDSALLAKELGLMLGDPWKALTHPIFAEMLDTYIGASKLVFLNAQGEHVIINEKAGVTENGVWYSNKTYEELRTRSAGNITATPYAHNSFARDSYQDPKEKNSNYIVVKRYPIGFKGSAENKTSTTPTPTTNTTGAATTTPTTVLPASVAPINKPLSVPATV